MAFPCSVRWASFSALFRGKTANIYVLHSMEVAITKGTGFLLTLGFQCMSRSLPACHPPWGFATFQNVCLLPVAEHLCVRTFLCEGDCP